MEYYQGFISATSEKEAHAILDEFLAKHFVAGGHIISGESNHWWQGDIERLPYWSIMIFTKPKNADDIIGVVERLSKDDSPVVSFIKIEKMNQKGLDWIEEGSE